MRVIFCKYRKRLHTGNLVTCLTWATRMALAKNVLIQVFSIRPESKEAKLLFEVSKEGIRPIPSGNYARILKGAKWVTL